MFGMLDGRTAKLGRLQPSATMAARPMRPFDPLAKPQRPASAMAIGTRTTARPTEDGITKLSAMLSSIMPPINRA